MAGSTKIWQDGNLPQCNASDLNGFKNENNNLILGSGQVLDTGDTQQTHKAVSVYAAAGDYYTDTGVADAMVAAAVGARAAPPVLSNGVRVRIKPAADNTGPVTITNATWGGPHNVLSLTGAALAGGELQAGIDVELVYDGSDFRLISVNPNRLDSIVLSNSADADLTDTDVPLNIGADDPDTQSHLELSKHTIQAKDTATTEAAAPLEVNTLGGDVEIGNKSGTTGQVRLYGRGGSGLKSFESFDDRIEFTCGPGGNPSTSGTQDILVRWLNDNGDIVASMEYNGTINLGLTNRVRQGRVLMSGLNGAGVEQAIFVGLPDGETRLHYDGAETCRTAISTNGGFLIDNAVSGLGGLERALTISDINNVRQTSDLVKTNDTSLTVTELVYPGLSQGWYRVKGALWITAHNAGGFKAQIAAATLANANNIRIRWRYQDDAAGTQSTGNNVSEVRPSGTSSSFLGAPTAASTESYLLEFDGMLEMVNADELRLYFAQNASSGFATTLLTGSWMSVSRMA